MKRKITLLEVIPIVKYWQQVLGLTNWKISLIKTNKKEYSIRRDYCYLRALISVGKLDDNSLLEEYIIHELLHIPVGLINHHLYRVRNRLTPEERRRLVEAEEQIVETLARSFLRLRRMVKYSEK